MTATPAQDVRRTSIRVALAATGVVALAYLFVALAVIAIFTRSQTSKIDSLLQVSLQHPHLPDDGGPAGPPDEAPSEVTARTGRTRHMFDSERRGGQFAAARCRAVRRISHLKRCAAQLQHVTEGRPLRAPDRRIFAFGGRVDRSIADVQIIQLWRAPPTGSQACTSCPASTDRCRGLAAEDHCQG